MSENENKPKLATRDDKIRGCISIALWIGCWTFAFYQVDQKWLIPAMFAGFMYMLTSLAVVFKDM